MTKFFWIPSHFIQLCHLNAIVLTATKNMTILNGRFSKKGLHILQLNINSLLPNIAELRFIVKQADTSRTGISEFKLDSFILNSETDIEGYNVIRKDCSRRWGGVPCHTGCPSKEYIQLWRWIPNILFQ